MPDKRAQHREIPFSGRLITAEPASIGENFRTLKNMRYTDTHKKGVSGMTKINTTALTTYLKIRNAFHFRKAQPAESHLLVQAYNTGLTASQILQNTTAIPSAGDFSGTVLWPVTGASGAARGYFSDAPDGQMIYANEVDTCIFGGNEIRVGAFVTSAAALATIGASCTSPKDYTDVINNTKSDSANVAVIGGGNDTYTVLLIHGDSDIADSSVGGGGAPPKTVAAAGGAAYATDQAKFGAGSLKFDGTNDFFYVDSTDPDINDFFMSTGKFTIDFWIYPTVQTNKVFFQQYVDADNYVICGWMSSGSIMRFRVRAAGVTTVDLFFSTSEDFTNRWTHIAVVRGWGGNANDWALCTNGTARVTLTDADPWPDLNADFDIGQNSVDTAFFAGWIDEFRVSKGVARWTTDSFSSPASPYRAASLTFLIGSPRPASGAKFTVPVANAVANTLTVKEANGSAWVTLTHTDNTDTGGASFAQTGTITWATTINTSKPLYLEGYYAYWYQFTVDAGEFELSHVTLDCPFQALVDTWDGVFRDVTRFFQYTTVYLENTINVLREDYDSATASTYYAIGGLAAFSTPNNCLEVGFTEKQTGFRIGVAVANTTAATDMTVDFWDGTAYTTVGTISDGTKAGGTISLTVTGVVSWNNNSIAGETKKVVSNSPPLYYYRIRFNQAIVAGARIDYIGGITAQRTMSHFKFPVFAQGRVGLCADMSERKNKATWSSKFMPQVYNGADSVDVFYGEDGELTCGTELFSQFGSNLYSLILMFKDIETWVQAGQDIDQWEDNTFLLPGGDGCPAPLTLKTITFSTVVQEQTVTRTMAIWQGTNGIYVSEGRSLVPIHGDIREYFDRQDSRCIKASMIGDSVGFIDYARNEYHWLFASGTSTTTLNTELVYDISRNRWFEIDRSADLQCGVAVRDTDGNPYAYGFLDTGYMERLENGNTFDGTAITFTSQFGDMALAGLAAETRVSRVKLITVAKATTTNNITCTHYSDAGTVETAVAAQGTITIATAVTGTTWNPSDKSAGCTLSLANLKAEKTSGATWQGARSVQGVSSGKWYWEVSVDHDSATGSTSVHLVGVSKASAAYACGEDANGWAYHSDNGGANDGKKYNNNTLTAYGNGYDTAIISVALDMDAGKIWFAKNGTWQASGDPGAGTNEAFSGLSGTVYAAYAAYQGPSVFGTANFGASAFTYTVPTGFNSGFGVLNLPVANETFAIDTQTFTWKTTRTGTGEVTIGATPAACVTNIVTAITADMTTVTAVDGAGDTVVVTAATAGIDGNRIVFTESSTSMSMDGSTLMGGTTAGAIASATAKTMSPAKTGYRLALPKFTEKLNGDPFHSFKFVMTTSDETIGFEPLALVVTHHPVHED